MKKCERNEIRELVAAAQAGDGAALESLVARFRPTAFLVAKTVCANHEVAEDAVQDAFLTAFRALKNLQDPALFGPWLATIVRNRARTLMGEKHRVLSLPLHVLDQDVLRNVPSLSMPVPEVAHEAVRALPEGIRETMNLYYLEEWSVGEIAALLERPVTTVKWQLHAGRTLMRRRLGSSENLK